MNAPAPSGALAVPSLPIDQIIASPSNPRKRFDETYLAELCASIKAHGLIQPITVRPLPLDHALEYNTIEVIDGDRYDVRVGTGRNGLATDFGAEDLEKLAVAA